MRKQIIRTLSMTLACLLLFQLMPTRALAMLSNSEYGISIPAQTGYLYESSQESDNTVERIEVPSFIDHTNQTEDTIEEEDEIECRSGTDEPSDPVHIASPYSYNHNENERVTLNTGAIVYQNVDYVLPGRNGLDLVIGRIYDSRESHLYNASSHLVYYNSDYDYCFTTILNPNSYYQTRYQLGYGWQFMFSSLGNRHVYLSDGSDYKILRWNYTGYGDVYTAEWADYPFWGLELLSGITEFQSGGVTSCYKLTYGDGKTEYFTEDGRILGIKDRYGNKIRFEYSTVNGQPQIKIFDTLNRQVVISRVDTAQGYNMVVSLPNNQVITYEIASCTNINDVYELVSYTDQAGRETDYSYTIESAGISAHSNNLNDKTDYCLNLTTITHPTNAQTVYTYAKFNEKLKDSGLRESYRISNRKDVVGSTNLNSVNYSYSTNNFSGYPTWLTDTFTYTTSATDCYGTKTEYLFNHLHQLQSSTVSSGTQTLQRIEYDEYGSYGLATKKTTKTYNNAGNDVSSIERAYYDLKGNMTLQWSPLANGDTTDTEHETSWNYYLNNNMLLRKAYKQDEDTSIVIENTPNNNYTDIGSSKVYVNNVETQRTDYAYDSYGNIITETKYIDGTATSVTEYTYQNGAYLTQEKHTGVKTAAGTDAAATPGQSAGVVVLQYTYDNLGRMITSKDGNGNTTSYTYDALGNLTQQTNPDGTTVQYTRNYSANTLTVKDENNVSLRYTYTPLGLEYETVDVSSNQVLQRKEYDNKSRLIKVSEYVYGGVTEYTYDALDRVLSETKKQANTDLAQTTYAYDGAAEGQYRKVTKTVVGDSNAPSIVTTEYTDKCGFVAKTGKMLGGTEYFDTYTYDYIGNRLTERTAADAAKNLAFTTKYEYNENGQAVKSYNAANQYITNSYDRLGRLISSTDYAGTPTTYTYDVLGRLLTQTMTVESGKTAVTKYDYDAGGNLIREYKPTNAVGSSATWSKTEYEYNNRNRLSYVLQYNGNSVASVTKYTYDGVGNMVTMTAGLSSKTGTDGSTTSYSYNRYGQVLSETDALNKSESYSYSTLGKLQSKTDRNGVTTSYAYDALGRTVSVTAGSGNDAEVVNYTYTKTGEVREEENGWQRTTYTYDALGRVTTVSEEEQQALAAEMYTVTLDANGGSVTPGSITVYYGGTYDLPTPMKIGTQFIGWYLGDQLVQSGDIVTIEEDSTLVAHWSTGIYTIMFHSSKTGGATKTQECNRDEYITLLPNTFVKNGYSFAGWSTDRLSNVVTYTDQQSGLINLAPTGMFISLWAVWVNGSIMATPEDPTESTERGETDPPVIMAPPEEPQPEEQMGEIVTPEEENAQIRNVQPTTPVATSYTKTCTYDLANNRTGMTVTKDGTTVQSVTYTYDNLNRLSQVKENNTVAATYTYDTNGNRSSLTYANGDVSTYTYNLANWVTGLTNKKGSTTISSFTYTYYASGNQKTKVENGTTTTYTYDGLGRLTQEAESGGVTLTYTYNAAGNRTQLTATGTQSYTTNYTYDAANQLLTESKSGASGYTATYTYDNNGNTLTRTSTDSFGVTRYTYNKFNQQTEAKTGGTAAKYAYNPRGIRTSKIVGPTTTYYLLDGDNVIGEVQSGSVSATYLRGVNLIRKKVGSTLTYYEFNAHGDVVNLTNASGTNLKTYSYDAFGNEKNLDTADANSFRYCGEYYDKETGTYYLRARYYDPRNGRFTSRDTHWNSVNSIYGDNPQKINQRQDKLGLSYYSYAPQISAIAQAGNLYVYCMGNPVGFVDRSGEIAITTLILIGSAVVALVAAGITAYNSNKYTGEIDWANTITTGLSWFMLAYTLGMSAYGIYISYCDYKGISPVSELYFNGDAAIDMPNGTWVSVNESMSEASRNYQTQITGHTGEAYVLNGVKFDGVSNTGRLIEVKGNYTQFIDKSTGLFYEWFQGTSSLVNQAYRQIAAAGGVSIDWYFSDVDTMNAVRALFRINQVSGINYVYLPMH